MDLLQSKGRPNRLTSRISAGTGVGFGKTLTGCSEQLYNMSETEQDTVNVTISCLYKFMYEISTGATKYDHE